MPECAREGKDRRIAGVRSGQEVADGQPQHDEDGNCRKGDEGEHCQELREDRDEQEHRRRGQRHLRDLREGLLDPLRDAGKAGAHHR
jgi:hypothetical protein